MLKYEFQCSHQDYIEYNFYLALHDRSMQKRNVMFVFSFCIAIILLKLVLFPGWLAWIVASGLCLLYAFLFPKLYWSLVRQRIERITQDAPFQYLTVQLNFDQEITIHQNKQKQTIQYQDIVNIGWTKNLCLVFYKDNKQTNTIIIPLRFIDNPQQLNMTLTQGSIYVTSLK